MERSVSVRTPESIAFYYELAGLGSRFLALVVDVVIQWLIAVICVIVASLSAPRAGQIAGALHLNEKNLASTVIAIVIVLAFILGYGYFMIFEQLWNGQSPGKRLVGIRVVADGGYPVTLMDSIVRNLVRVFESAFFYLPSVISMVASSQNKRLGDYAAGTIVVRDRSMEIADRDAWLRPQPAALQQPFAATLSADEVALVERYLARRTMLPPHAARTAAAKIAGALRPKLGDQALGLADDELLTKVGAGDIR